MQTTDQPTGPHPTPGRPGGDLRVLVYHPHDAAELVAELRRIGAAGDFVACRTVEEAERAIEQAEVLIAGPFPVGLLARARRPAGSSRSGLASRPGSTRRSRRPCRSPA